MAAVRFHMALLGLFLGIMRAQAADPFLKQVQRGDLLDDLEAVLGQSSLRDRLEQLEARIQPMFLSLQKNSQNLLAHATARYALHRFFSDAHGWNIAGLEPNATTFNTTSLVGSGMLRGLVPGHVEGIIGEYIGADGFSLRELAIVSGTIEHLVHDDQKGLLRAACEGFGVSTTGPISKADMRHIIQFYMMYFVLSQDLTSATFKAPSLQRMFKMYPGWDQTVMLLDDELDTLTYNERDRTNPFQPSPSSLDVALRVVGQIADHFPRHQCEPECQEIKEDLLAYERGNTGRILLADFYRAGLDARFFFTETKEYLRAVGAVDESDLVWGPKVIVSNYVLSKSNCLAFNHVYSVCCSNECEGLYGSLEQTIAAPEATPQEIALAVAGLSSSTVQAPRNLSQALLRRLEEMADAHGGRVLLHGRLFAQWMHQAFPRECPYPHLVGSTTSLSPTDWANMNKQDYRIDARPMNDMQRRNHTLNYIKGVEGSEKRIANTSTSEEDEGADLMWTLEEEHFVEPTRSRTAQFRGAFAYLASGVASGMCLVLVFSVLTAKGFVVWRGGDTGKVEKYFV